MAPKKIQVIPNGDSLKTKWSRAIRYARRAAFQFQG